MMAIYFNAARCFGRQKGGMKIKIEIPYGKDTVQVQVEEDCEVLLPKKFAAKDEDDILSESISEPIGKEPFAEFAGKVKKLLIIVTDSTRPTPTSKVIGHLYPSITENDVEFLVATGTHRAPTNDEFRTIFGDFYNEFKDRVYVHDAKNQETNVYVGKTSRGTEVYFNNMVIEADGIVGINSVKPHYFAGFTGGRKMFLPGTASYKTIETNHSHATSDDAQPMVLKGNPVAEDMDEAAGFLNNKEIFSIQTVMGGDKKVHAVVSGDLFRSFEAAVQHARDLYSVHLKSKGNIVLTANPYPMDINLYQSQHALENSKLAIEKGGVMILVSKCWDGAGNPAYLDFLDKVRNLEDVDAILKSGYKLGDHKGARIMRMRAYADLWAVTDLDDDVVLRSKMKPYHDVQKALDDAVKQVMSQDKEPKILVIPSGGMTVPYLTS